MIVSAKQNRFPQLCWRCPHFGRESHTIDLSSFLERIRIFTTVSDCTFPAPVLHRIPRFPRDTDHFDDVKHNLFNFGQLCRNWHGWVDGGRRSFVECHRLRAPSQPQSHNATSGLRTRDWRSRWAAGRRMSRGDRVLLFLETFRNPKITFILWDCDWDRARACCAMWCGERTWHCRVFIIFIYIEHDKCTT